MTRTLSLLFISLGIICTSALTLYSQAIHDAVELRKKFLSPEDLLYENEDPNTLYNILAKNISEKDNWTTKNDIVDAYKDNPFIKGLLAPDLGGQEDFTSSFDPARGSLEGISSGMGLPASTFLMGLTEFLVKRTKQELTIAFFRDFQKIVQDSEEMSYLFPSTSKVLLKIGEDIYRFKAFWEVLRESFLKDLENLVYNLDDYVQLSSRIKNPVVRDMMTDFFKVIELFYDKTSPANVITYLADDAYLHTIDAKTDSTKFITALQASLKILGLFSQSLETKDADGYWVKPDKVVEMVKDPMIARLYLGLLYQKGKHIQITKDKTFAQCLKGMSGIGSGSGAGSINVRNLLNIVKGFIDKAKMLHRLTESMRKKANDRRRNGGTLTEADKQLDYDEYFEFTQGICDMILYTYEFKKEILGSSSKEDSLVYKYLSIIGDINGMALSIRKKEYTSALMSTLFIIEKMLPKDGFACERKVLLKYGTFIATAVNAKTSKEVADAISAFALPPGGSAIKKYSKFRIALNAYVGLGAGQELLTDKSTNEFLSASPFYAVTTPIGVTFNFGFKNYGSISLLASVLDIGALTAFSFQGGTGSIPDLQFENVLAPGGYLVYGLPKYPISIGIGAQLGPNLKSVTNGNLVTSASGWRWGAFIAVDIPMVSVFTTNKAYKQCPRPCKNCDKKKKKK